MSNLFKPWMRLAIGEALLAWVAVWLTLQPPGPKPYCNLAPLPLIVGAAIGLPYRRPFRGAVIGLLCDYIIAGVLLLIIIAHSIFDR